MNEPRRDLSSEDPKRAITNAADRIRRTVDHLARTASTEEARATFEAVSVSITADVDIIEAAVANLPG